MLSAVTMLQDLSALSAQCFQISVFFSLSDSALCTVCGVGGSRAVGWEAGRHRGWRDGVRGTEVLRGSGGA